VARTNDAEQVLDSIWTVPDAVSAARLVLFGWFLWTLFGAGDRLFAASLLAVCGVTDFLDGFAARRLHQVSALGKILDPTIDRAMLTGTVIALIVEGALPPWLGGLALFREVGVALAAMILASRGARRLEVLWVGKAGTFGFMCALPLLLESHARGTVESVLGATAWVIIVPSLVLSFVSAASYVPQARRALRDANPSPLGAS
jgi:cardiolipin synthase